MTPIPLDDARRLPLWCPRCDVPHETGPCREEPKRTPRPQEPSAAEESLAMQLETLGLEGWVREHRFHPERRWRFDFAWPAAMFAVEVEGGTHSGGRHVRGQGFRKDAEKYGEALVMGWSVLRLPSGMVFDGSGIDLIQRWFRQRPSGAEE